MGWDWWLLGANQWQLARGRLYKHYSLSVRLNFFIFLQIINLSSLVAVFLVSYLLSLYDQITLAVWIKIKRAIFKNIQMFSKQVKPHDDQRLVTRDVNSPIGLRTKAPHHVYYGGLECSAPLLCQVIGRAVLGHIPWYSSLVRFCFCPIKSWAQLVFFSTFSHSDVEG